MGLMKRVVSTRVSAEEIEEEELSLMVTGSMLKLR